MSNYINDPREMAIRPESGVTLEEDNRVETMYHWGAKVLDLCDLPVEEYMKPMTVITKGGGGDDPESGDTPTKKVKVSMKVSVVSPDGDIIAQNGDVIGNMQGDGTWKVRWIWDNDFTSTLASSVIIYDENSQEIAVASNIANNNNHELLDTISELTASSNVTGIGECTIGKDQSSATGSSITIKDEDANKEYNIVIKPTSSDEPMTDCDIYYSFNPKPIESTYGDLMHFTLLDAKDDDGVEITAIGNISEDYVEEANKFDNEEPPYDGDDNEELWEAFVEEYEAENKYILRIYIPMDIEELYDYKLYNDNGGILTDANLVRTGVYKTYGDIVYSEYVNDDDSYFYDDTYREFKLRMIITEK